MTPEQRIYRLVRAATVMERNRDNQPSVTVKYGAGEVMLNLFCWRVGAPTLDQGLAQLEGMVREMATGAVTDRREDLDEAMARQNDVERILSET